MRSPFIRKEHDMRIVEEKLTADGKYIRTYFGNSSETKPTADLADGSVFVEVDTGNAVLFNETAGTWA
jgi:hypothetical protein